MVAFEEAQVVVETTCLQGTWNLHTFWELLSHGLIDASVLDSRS